jgi:hypothetical protein
MIPAVVSTATKYVGPLPAIWAPFRKKIAVSEMRLDQRVVYPLTAIEDASG